MKLVFYTLHLYRILISPFLQAGFGIQCRYPESCSRYAERMLKEKGFWKGSLSGMKRFLQCNPFFNAREDMGLSQKICMSKEEKNYGR